MTKKKKEETKKNNKNESKQKNIEKKINTNTKKEGGDKSMSFPIVGIGASAGGLEAFKAFFSGMPDDTELDMAFVLVQHLAPDHKSALTNIIRNFTNMKVLEVKDGMKVECNSVYIIPPNYDMTFIDGALKLNEPSASRGHRMPIDIFFRSLAEDLSERAIGIILSGTGSDGTLGLRAIKGEGGMAMVQKPESASYGGMPNSAIETGLVDYELPPAEMPEQLIAYVSHFFGKLEKSAQNQPNEEKLLKKIFITLRNQTGHDFSEYKRSTIKRRIQHRMSVQQIETVDKYVKYIQQTPEEVKKLFNDLLIGVTNFFRDPEAFKVLEKEIIPSLFAKKRESGILRLWVSGCSTGEEAYSLAILIAECQDKLNQIFKVQIFATDIDSNAIIVARRGLFPGSIAEDITKERLSSFFNTNDNGKTYRIQKRIREMVIFSEQNLIEDPPFSRLDLISCRNLLIYMQKDLQKKIISLFSYALNPGGYLFLGNSETLGEANINFSTVNSKWKLYQLKKDIQTRQLGDDYNFLPPMRTTDTDQPQLDTTTEEQVEITLRELTEQKILDEFSPPAVLVNSYGQVLYIHGHTGLYLELFPGLSGVNNILKMAREGLQTELISALHEAVSDQKKVVCNNLRIESDEFTTRANLTVCPMKKDSNPKFDETLYLIVLERISSSEKESIKDITDQSFDEDEVDYGPESKRIIADLRQKLEAKKQTLQNTVEELQTANEELKSSNEELQSLNEELQSTNEELETSKEELQSLNEELKTVNNELENKVAELTQANTDMNNLLSGTGIGTVFVDLNLRIMRFTPSAKEFINLIESDVGRPVGHIVSNLKNYDSLPEDTQEILDTLVPKEVEVQTNNGQWYMMRIQPYRTEKNVIKGAVITFRDINERKQIQNELNEVSNLLAEKMVTVVREPMLVLDTDFRVVAINSAFYDTFKVRSADHQNQLLFDIDNSRWDIPQLHELLNKILDQTDVIYDYQIKHKFEDIGECNIRINARRISTKMDTTELILLTMEKINSSIHSRTDKNKKESLKKESGEVDGE
ncbi:MAG: chemotaxis protein CheB [Bacillota bacterium]